MLYERARTALVAHLRGLVDPALTEAEITRERLALEEAIRKVDAEAARRGRPPTPDPKPPFPPKPTHDAVDDNLTGLPNRELFLERLKQLCHPPRLTRPSVRP